MDAGGRFQGSFAMCSDITDRKTAEIEIALRNDELHAAYEQLTATEQELQKKYNELATSRKMLEESEKRYRDVVEDQTELISRFLPDGTHVFVNNAYCRYFGLKREEILGHRFRPVVPADDGLRIAEALAALTPENPVAFIRQRVISPDGSVRWQRWSDRAIYDDAGNLVEYQSVGRDITDIITAEQSFLASENRFREQYQNNPLAIITWRHKDGEFIMVDCNSAAEKISSGRVLDYLGKTGSACCITRPELLTEIRQCFSERTVISKELVSEIFLPGRLVSVTAAFVPPDLIMVHLEDITERRSAEEALRESQRLLGDVMDLANLVTWECDLGTGILRFDDRFSTLYGPQMGPKGISRLTLDEYLNEIVHPEDRKILEQEYENARKTTNPLYVSRPQYRIIRRDGGIRYIETCVGITKDSQGRTIKTHGVNQDITERKTAEEALRKANHQLSLLSGITRHDILNKITGIIGYLKLAEMKVSDPVIDEYLGKMESAIMEVQSQIDFTRIYQDLGTHQPQWIDLDTVMPRAHTLLTISLKADVKGMEVYADPMLEKVFSNLLDNSLRHGERVTSIRVSSHEAGGNLVVVWEDDGVGISPDEKDRIFDRGFGKNSGFGLFLIREILSLTGITILETGEPGKGARFEIMVLKNQYRSTGSGEKR
jgi:PAS domain S-box-containing protein